MIHVLSTAAAVALVLACASGAVASLDKGSVRDVPTVSSLNVSQYLGLWYQVYSDAFDSLFEPDVYCATANYGLNTNGTVSVLNIDRKGGFNGTRGAVRGYAFQPNPTTFPGRLEVVFPFTPIPSPYWVLQVGPVVKDQYQYTVVSDFEKISLFVMARNVTEYNTAYSLKVADFLQSMGFDGLFNSPYVVPQGLECQYG